MPRVKLLKTLTGMLALAAAPLFADEADAIQKKLVSEYALTQPTADNADIVTPGAVLVLQKSDLMLGPATANNLYQNQYKDGKITQGTFAKGKSMVSKFGRLPGVSMIPGVGTVATTAASTADAASGAAPRTYVTGEKIRVTKIEVKTENKQEEVVFQLFTDPFDNVRYKGSLKIPYPNGATADDVDKLVAQVFRVQPAEDAQQSQTAQSQQQAPAGSAPGSPVPPQASAMLPEIVPPPPPIDQPAPTPLKIEAGQTIDEVVAALGQPQKVVKLAKKEMYYYQDFKVVFVNGKVSDVQ